MSERILVILVNLSWQLALIFALIWLILAAFRIHSASTRHIIWLAVVLCPLVLIPMNVISSDIVLFRTGIPESGLAVNYPLYPTTWNSERGEMPPSVVTPASDQPSASILVRIAPLFVLIWFICVGGSFVLIFIGYARLRKLISEAHQVSDEQTLRIFHQIKGEMGLSRSVRLFTSDRAQIPFSIGFVHPCIVLPDRMRDSDEKLRMVLIHEMAHLKRFDDLTNLMRRFAESLVFFHPLFHLAARELELSSEQICDGWTMNLTGTRKDYVDCLVELSRSCVGRLPIGFSRRGNSMTKRIKSIFRDEEVFKAMGRKSIILLSITLFLLALMVSALRLVDPASAEQSTPTAQIKLEISSPVPGKAYGTMTLDNQAVSMENLADMLQKYDLNQKQVLVIVSDRDVQHFQIVQAMDILKKTGIGKIGFALALQIRLEISSPEPGEEYGTMVLDNQAASMENLSDMLQQCNLSQKQVLVIVSDRHVQKDQIVQVMDIAKEAGIDEIRFALASQTKLEIRLEIKSPEPGKAYGAMVLDNQALSMENLADMLQKYDLNQEQTLIIVSDRDVQHFQIVKAMDIFKKAGIDEIGFAFPPL